MREIVKLARAILVEEPFEFHNEIENALRAELGHELALVQGHRSESTDQDGAHWRRIQVRSIFAAIEGIASVMRTAARRELSRRYRAKDYWHTGTDAESRMLFEMDALADEKYTISSHGISKPTKLTLGTEAGVLFSIRMLAIATGNAFDPKAMRYWHEYTLAENIRNRVTHPKTVDEMLVTQADADIVGSAFLWFVECDRRARGITIVWADGEQIETERTDGDDS